MSLLQQELERNPLRSLPVALGQEIANTPASDTQRLELLNRIYLSLKPADRLRCRDEIHQCRAAKRGDVEALVA